LSLFDAVPFLVFSPFRGPAFVVHHGPELEENKQGKEMVKFADGLANVACGIVEAGDRVCYQQASK